MIPDNIKEVIRMIRCKTADCGVSCGEDIFQGSSFENETENLEFISDLIFTLIPELDEDSGKNYGKILNLILLLEEEYDTKYSTMLFKLLNEYEIIYKGKIYVHLSITKKGITLKDMKNDKCETLAFDIFKTLLIKEKIQVNDDSI